jgi:hypothetical protein
MEIFIMGQSKLLLLALLAALTLCAFMSSAASAACNVNTGKFVFCNDAGAEIGAPQIGLAGTSGVTLLDGQVRGTAVKIECKMTRFKLKLLTLGKLFGALEMLECKTTAPAGCVIMEAFEPKVTGQLVGVMGKPEYELAGSKPGEELFSIEINNCPTAEGIFAVTGQQLVEDTSGEGLALAHEIVAKKSGSKLKLGSEPASFSSTVKVQLESDLAWLIMLGS